MFKLLRKTLFSRNLFKIIIVVSLAWSVVVVGLAAMIHTYSENDEVAGLNEPSADAIVVLGAGLSREGRAGNALWRRTIRGAELYQRGLAPAVICTGGVGAGQVRSEASVCGEILQWRGVPESAIYLEEQSHSTEENAIYAREILDEQRWQDVILVTDSFHMLRAQWIFDAEGINSLRSPVSRDQVRYYTPYFIREIVALHWQAFKTVFNLPFTNI